MEESSKTYIIMYIYIYKLYMDTAYEKQTHPPKIAL